MTLEYTPLSGTSVVHIDAPLEFIAVHAADAAYDAGLVEVCLENGDQQCAADGAWESTCGGMVWQIGGAPHVDAVHVRPGPVVQIQPDGSLCGATTGDIVVTWH